MSLELEMIADYECLTGEGPFWQPEEQCVYWLDIPAGKIFRFDPNVNTHRLFYEGPEPIGGFTLQEDGAFLLFGNRGAIIVLRDGTATPMIPEIPAEADGRFNDVIADPLGRVFCGTMPTDTHMGRLYRLDLDGTLTAVLDDVNISNGMGFTPGLTGMYHTDTVGRTISLFDYDQATGALTNRRSFAHTPTEAGMPDGMTVDAEGCVWSAQWDGGCLIRYAPDGTELRRITFPAKKVSSAIFGGPDLMDLYVTTAGGDNKAANGPGAGALFRVRLDVRGVPEYRSRIQFPGS